MPDRRHARGRIEHAPASKTAVATREDRAFAQVVEMIRAARGRALVAVNAALVDLYWRIGEFISRKLEQAI